MEGFDVSPVTEYASMYFWIVPLSSMLRVMLSSQRLCPRSLRVSVAFTVLLPEPCPVVAGPAHRLWRLSLAGRGHAIARDLSDLIRGEAELDEQLLQRRRRAEGAHPDHRAAVTDVAVPAEGGCLLHRDPGLHRGREHLVAVLLGLAVEKLPAGQAYHPGADAAGLQLVPGGQRQLHLGPGGEQDDVGCAAVGLGQHIAAPGHPRRRPEH